MIMLIAIGLGVVALLLMARLFLVSEPGSLARVVRLAGPVALVLVGLALIGIGRVAFGVPAAAAGLVWGALQFRRRPGGRAISARVPVRTAAIEMDLDRRNGVLDGTILAGRHIDRRLASLSLDELFEVWADLAADPESLHLLAAYLDGRFPVWRDRAKADGRPGQRGAPGAGAMTEQEAYKILGLEAGASAADIRKAHRRLVQRLDPGIAADSLLVARIDKAKAILLAKHG
jgi:hypothetical protein